MVILVPLVVVAVTNNLSISLPKYFLERYFDETVLRPQKLTIISTPLIKKE